jgi:hypothetical protein
VQAPPSLTAVEPDTQCFALDRAGPRSPDQTSSTAAGIFQPRVTVFVGPFDGFMFSVSHGYGSRSLDPQYISQNFDTPFARVRATEGGVVYTRSTGRLDLSARSVFFQTSVDRDLFFNQTEGRNTLANGTTRTGWAGNARATGSFFDLAANLTLVRATFDDTKLLIPYAPDLVARVDAVVFSDLPWALGGARPRGSAALGASYVGRRPLPFDERSQVFAVVDGSLNASWKLLQVGLICTNLLDRRYRLAEYNYTSDFRSQPFPTLTPSRHFNAGEPRAFYGTLTINIDPSPGSLPRPPLLLSALPPARCPLASMPPRPASGSRHAFLAPLPALGGRRPPTATPHGAGSHLASRVPSWAAGGQSALRVAPSATSNRRAFLAALAAGSAALPFASCDGSTGGSRFDFYARAGGIERDASAPFRFENELGWQIELAQADLTVGPVYLNTVAPLRSARHWGVPFVRSAYADDSHLGEGTVVGEVLAQVTANLLSPELVTFPAWGTTTSDRVRSLEICYYPNPGEPPDTPGAGVAALRVAGRAIRGGQDVTFRGDLAIDATWQPSGQPGSNNYEPLRSLREVRGVPASFTPGEGGWLELRVDAARFFRGANFDALAQNPVDTDGVTRLLVQAKGATLSTDSVMRALFNNVRASAAGTYAARWRDA